MSEEIDLAGFLTELSELAVKYRIAIGACGCCYGPYLVNFDGDYKRIENADIFAKSLNFDVSSQAYTVTIIPQGEDLLGNKKRIRGE